MLVLVSKQPVGWLGRTLSGALVERLGTIQGPTTSESGTPVRLSYPDGRAPSKRVHRRFLARDLTDQELDSIEALATEVFSIPPAERCAS